MLRRSFWLSFIVVIASALFSCKPSTPDYVLSEGKMVDILYDYHRSKAMLDVTGSDPKDAFSYKAAVMKKHGVSGADFDSSLVYYMRHTEQLQHIYEKVSDRLKSDEEKMGATASELNQYGNLSAKGDTASIWTHATSLLFLPQVPFNQFSFNIVADSSYHAGDKILLNFDTKFLYQDGIKSACAVLAVVFKNDSIASTTSTLSTSNHYSMELNDWSHKGIKAVKGYFILTKSQNKMESQTTLQMLFIDNIHLIKMHENKKLQEEMHRADSINELNRQRNLRTPNPSGTPLPRPHIDGQGRPVPSSDVSKTARVTL